MRFLRKILRIKSGRINVDFVDSCGNFVKRTKKEKEKNRKKRMDNPFLGEDVSSPHLSSNSKKKKKKSKKDKQQYDKLVDGNENEDYGTVANHPLYYDESSLDYKKQLQTFISNFPQLAKNYLQSLFPIISWLPRYNATWMYGDLIAAITISFVVIPQGMAYAKIATLPVQYGLYSSFTGVLIYCFFATSKDITIGPVAVMSLLLGEILNEMKVDHPEFSPVLIASSLALLSGLITLFLGLFRLGFIIDFISGPSIAGFMSGSAATIAINQLPNLFGIPNINTREEAYSVLWKTMKDIGHSTVDASMGVTILVLLYIIRFGSEYLSKRYPKYKKPLFFANTARSVIMVVVATFIAFLICKDHKSSPPIKIVGTVPSGLHDIRFPSLSVSLLEALLTKLPVVVLVLVLEHVAIAKSFGRLNDYVINPNQEFIAIGVANVVGSFFSSYPATGSFSRTAIKAKAGVKTPLAGVYSGVVVLLAIYLLTPVFYYIPSACLSAVIIHAVVDLFSGPKTWIQFWKVSPFEFIVFVLGVGITFFTDVETGIYISVGFSLFLLLQRIARPSFSVLGRVPIYKYYPSKSNEGNGREETNANSNNKSSEARRRKEKVDKFVYVSVDASSDVKSKMDILPMPDGVVVVRLQEAYTYPNASYITDKIIEASKKVTRRGGPPLTAGERAWNDQINEKDAEREANLPILKAIVVDFVSVNHFDSTGLQGLMAARATLDRYAGQAVEWHFANISNTSIKRTLYVGGFGGLTPQVTETNPMGIVPTLNTKQSTPAVLSPSMTSISVTTTSTEPDDVGDVDMTPVSPSPSPSSLSVDHSTEFIHFDLDSAILSASQANFII